MKKLAILPIVVCCLIPQSALAQVSLVMVSYVNISNPVGVVSATSQTIISTTFKDVGTCLATIGPGTNGGKWEGYNPLGQVFQSTNDPVRVYFICVPNVVPTP